MRKGAKRNLEWHGLTEWHGVEQRRDDTMAKKHQWRELMCLCMEGFVVTKEKKARGKVSEGGRGICFNF